MSLLAPAVLAQTTMPAPGASGLVFWLVGGFNAQREETYAQGN